MCLTFQVDERFQNAKKAILRFVSLDNKIRNLTFINFAQNYTVGREIFWK